MLKQLLRSIPAICLSTLAVWLGGLSAKSAIAQEVVMQQDALDTYDGLPWAAEKWSYNTLVSIQKFGGVTIGKAVLDRHAEQNARYNLSLSAFSLMPVTVIFVSSWGSTQQGCAMEMLVQIAPEPTFRTAQSVAPYLVPKQVQVDVGNQRVVTLTPQNVTPRIGGPYVYQYYNLSDKKNYPASWYMARNVFKINAQQAELLRTAKPGNAQARLTFYSGQSYQIPIGEGTVTRWKDAFGYNPTCRPGGHTQVATQPKPLSSPVSTSNPTKPPVQNNTSQSSSPATPPKPKPSPVQPLARNAIGSTTPAKYPSNDEFKVLNQELKTAQSGVQLSAAQRRTWQSFKGGWSKTNPPIARFLGVWYNGDRYFYIYPSQVRSRVCVIVNDQGQVSSRLGTVLNKELRNGNSSFFWIDKEDVLAARDSGEEKLYPIFATQAPAPELSAEIIEAMDRAQCQKSLPQVEQALLP